MKDILPGTVFGYPQYFTISNGILFFNARSTNNNKELWKTDGTEVGTVMIKEIYPGTSNSSNPEYLTDIDGTLFFSANDGINGIELWKSDGTEAGTVMVKNINDDDDYSQPKNFINVDGIAYFTADDGIYGDELWKSDGTENGTQLVMNINTEDLSYFGGDDGSEIEDIIYTGVQLIFGAKSLGTGNELWEYTPGLQYAIITTHPEDVIICENTDASFSITADNTISYQWQVDDGTGFANISGGIYSGETTNTLTLTAVTYDYYGYKYKCLAQNTGGNIESLPATLFVYNAPTTANAGTNAENLCEGLEYTLSANEPTSEETGTWTILSGGTGTFSNQYSNTATFTADADGTFILTWTIDNGNCQSSSEVEITLAVDAENPTITCIENTTVTANQFYVYVVNGTEFDPTSTDDNCGIASIENNINVLETLENEQLSEGMHTVEWTVTDESENEATCSFTITVNAYVGINNILDNEISISPNPTTGIVNINLTDLKDLSGLSLQIIDITGKIIYSKDKACLVTIDISNQPAGIYFIKIQTENEIITRKLIKQ